jgi:hypothetical protein
MLRELDWLSIHQHIIVFQSIMFIWDVLHGDNEELKKFMRQNSDVHSYSTRNLHNFHMPMQNNTSGQKSLFVNGLKLLQQHPWAHQEGRPVIKCVQEMCHKVYKSLPSLPSSI